MARDISSAMQLAVTTSVMRPALVARIQTNSDVVRVWSGVGTLSFGSEGYTGVGYLGGVSPVEESTDGRATGMAFQLSGVPSALLSVALAQMRLNRPAKLWLGLLQEQVTQVMTHSDAIDNAVWSKNGTCTVSADALPGPDGGQTADWVAGLDTFGNHLSQGPLPPMAPIGLQYTPDFWLYTNSPYGVLRVLNPWDGNSGGHMTVDLSKLNSGWNHVTAAHSAATMVMVWWQESGSGLHFSAASGGPLAFGLTHAYLTTVNNSVTMVASPYLLFQGLTDAIGIDELPEGATITVNAESRLIDMERPRARRYTSEDQKTLVDSADLGFDFIPALQDAQIVFGGPG